MDDYCIYSELERLSEIDALRVICYNNKFYGLLDNGKLFKNVNDEFIEITNDFEDV
jgi:hypothetical protein